MRLNGRQKIGLGVLGVGLIAFAVDRTVLFSGGQTAMAAAPEAIPDSAAAPNTKQTPRAGRHEDGTLADRLSDLRHDLGYRPGTLPDAFATPPSWTADAAATVNDSPAPIHVLSSVVTGGESEGMARIDGLPYRVGQTRNGIKLLEVDQRSAVVEAEGRTLRLQLAEPDLRR